MEAPTSSPPSVLVELNGERVALPLYALPFFPYLDAMITDMGGVTPNTVIPLHYGHGEVALGTLRWTIVFYLYFGAKHGAPLHTGTVEQVRELEALPVSEKELSDFLSLLLAQYPYPSTLPLLALFEFCHFVNFLGSTLALRAGLLILVERLLTDAQLPSSGIPDLLVEEVPLFLENLPVAEYIVRVLPYARRYLKVLGLVRGVLHPDLAPQVLASLPKPTMRPVVCGGSHTLLITPRGLFGCGASDFLALKSPILRPPTEDEKGISSPSLVITDRLDALVDLMQTMTVEQHNRFAKLLGAGESDAELEVDFTNDAAFWAAADAFRAVTGMQTERHLADTLNFAEVEEVEGELITMACGENYTMLITTAGLFACGRFGHGQLGVGGVGGVTNRDRLQKVATEGRPLAVSCGLGSTMLITTVGLFASGKNHYSQLGLGDQRDRLQFERVAITGTPLSVVCGPKRAIAITTAGLFACGSNKSGQLGFTNHVRFPLFTEVLGVPGKPLSVVCAAKLATLLITTEGLLGAGKNHGACLGLGNRKWKSDQFRGVATSPHGKPVVLSASYTHTMLITTRGLFGCGLNREGELGLGNRAESYSFEEVRLGDRGQPIFVACGDSFTLLLTDGALLATGDNPYGQLGLGDRLQRKAFQAVALDLFPQESEEEPECKRQRTGCHICGEVTAVVRQEVARQDRLFCSEQCQRRFHWFERVARLDALPHSGL